MRCRAGHQRRPSAIRNRAYRPRSGGLSAPSRCHDPTKNARADDHSPALSRRYPGLSRKATATEHGSAPRQAIHSTSRLVGGRLGDFSLRGGLLRDLLPALAGGLLGNLLGCLFHRLLGHLLRRLCRLLLSHGTSSVQWITTGRLRPSKPCNKRPPGPVVSNARWNRPAIRPCELVLIQANRGSHQRKKTQPPKTSPKQSIGANPGTDLLRGRWQQQV